MDPNAIWIWSLVGGAVVILLVAALLLAIIATARSIDMHALALWTVGKNIATNTVCLWMLNRTNQIAREILATTQSMDASIKSLAGKAGKGRAP